MLDKITDPSMKRHILTTIASLRTLLDITKENEKKMIDKEMTDEKGEKKWKEQMSIVKRMREMERQHELYHHLGR